MLHFSWKKIYAHSEGIPSEILLILRMLTYKDIPVNRKDKIYKYSQLDFSGNCFLVHPDLLLYNAYKYESRDIAIYVSLASLRSYPEYVAYGTTTLNLAHSPVDPRDYLTNPELLAVDGDKNIHFLYEEVTHQTKH